MSSMTDMIPALRALAETETHTVAFITRALPLLVQGLGPLAADGRVVRVTATGCVLRASTVAEDVPDSVVADVLYERLRQQPRAQVALPQRRLLAPLFSAGALEGLLDIVIDPAYPLTGDTAADCARAQTAADLLMMLIENRVTHNALRRTAQLSASLRAATTYEAMIAALAQQVVQPGQFLTLNLYERDSLGSVTGFRTVASASQRQSQSTGALFTFSVPAEFDLYEALNSGGDVVMDDVARDPRLGETSRRQLVEAGVRGLLLLPLQTVGRVNGFIGINDTRGPLALLAIEREMLDIVVNQVAALLDTLANLNESQQSASQSRQQVQVLRLLNDLAIRSNVEVDETRITHRAAAGLVEAIGADRCGIALIDPDRQHSTVIGVYPPDEAIVGLKFDLTKHTIARHLSETGEPLLIPDLAADTTLDAFTRQPLLNIGIQAAIFLPIFDLERTLIGSVGLDFFQPRPVFSTEMLDIARTFVGQLGVSLQKIRLLQSSRRQSEQMQRITGFSQAVQTALDTRLILETALQHVPGVLLPDYIGIMLYDREAGYLRQVARWQDASPEIDLPGTLLTPGVDTLAHRVWDEQQPLRVDDLRSTWEWQHPYRNTYRALLAAPITSGTARRGVLQVAALGAAVWSEGDVAAIQQLCSQLAIALDNTEAFERSQRIARHKALANQIATRLQEQMEIEGILSTTIHELGRAVRARRARIRLGLQAGDVPRNVE